MAGVAASDRMVQAFSSGSVLPSSYDGSERPPPYASPAITATVGVFTGCVNRNEFGYVEAGYPCATNQTSVVLNFDRLIDPVRDPNATAALTDFIQQGILRGYVADNTKDKRIFDTKAVMRLTAEHPFPPEIEREYLHQDLGVKEVLINLSVGPTIHDHIIGVNSALVKGVAGACRFRFPNMNPARSHMNIHAGQEVYIAGKEMLTQGYPSNEALVIKVPRDHFNER